MKKTLYILLLSFVLFSCSKEEEEVKKTIKQDFYIEVKKVSEFGKDLNFEKTGKLSSSQDISLSAKANGRLSSIYVKEGDYVKKGVTIAILEDNISNYGLFLERAKNSLDKAKLNYETTENQLNKQISDIKINLENLKIDGNNSKSSLELEKLENSIKKIDIDYDNLKISNTQTISSFKASMGKDLVSFGIYIDDIITFSDQILGVTDLNKEKNDKFEDYIGAKNTSQKRESEQLLRELISYKANLFENIIIDFEGNELFDSNMLYFLEGYKLINDLLVSLEITIDNSITSVGTLSTSTISGYKASINGLWSSYSLNNSKFISLKSSINSFLDTYINTEKSLLKQIELLEADKKIYIKGLDTKLEIDKSTLIEAISNKDLTLRQLDISIIDARLSYKEALQNFDKLTIKSPINGIIGEIFVDIGQEVAPGSKLFTLSNNFSSEVIISFSKEELNSIGIGNTAYVNVNGVSHTGSIYSISGIADKNLKYIGRISFPNGVNLIGYIVDIKIPISIKETLLPINLLKIDKYGSGIINTLSGGKIEQITIPLGNIYSDKVELGNNIDKEIMVITNNIDNFDSEKFNLKIK